MGQMTTAEAIIAALIAHGLDTLYALPGVQNDHLFDALFDARLADGVADPEENRTLTAAFRAVSKTVGRGVRILPPLLARRFLGAPLRGSATCVTIRTSPKGARAMADEIISEMAAVRDWGGRFVVPIPNVQILD